MEFDLSHSGNGLKAIGSGAKLEGNDTALYGFEEYLRFSLAKSKHLPRTLLNKAYLDRVTYFAVHGRSKKFHFLL